MKYFKRLNLYKANNVQFKPETNTATSYDWWEFVKEIKGKIVFNNYNYSNSTCKHQSKVRWDVLMDLNIDIDVEIEAPQGLQNLSSAIDHYNMLISDLKEAISKPRTHKSKNQERKEQIKSYQAKIKEVKKLMR